MDYQFTDYNIWPVSRRVVRVERGKEYKICVVGERILPEDLVLWEKQKTDNKNKNKQKVE